MLENLKIENLLVLDIETVPAEPIYEDLNPRWQELWAKKAALLSDTESPDEIYNRAGIYAEFGKIVCISVGIFVPKGEGYNFRIKSFFGDDEKALLREFNELLNSRYSSPNKALCAHNGKEFDFPYISRRSLIHGLKLPYILDNAGKKPWEVNHIDTMQLWKFGDFKSYTSLDLLAAVFDIPTPKDDIDGSMVHEVYYVDGDLERIVRYCEKDIITLANVLLKFKGLDLLQEQDIFHSTTE
jgi:predicted PolB exonuclease-like 3'-5' exonuclease